MLFFDTAVAAVPAVSATSPSPTVATAGDQSALSADFHERLLVRRSDLNVLAGQAMSSAGMLKPALRGARVSLQLRVGRRWVSVSHSHTGTRGRFILRYVPHRTGVWDVRLTLHGTADVAGARRRLGRLSAFRAVEASWYGGGGGLACGGALTSSTMGVANKTLPCGTWVTLRYRSRSVRVQVVDRGPYVAGREYDLTEATKAALGFEGVGVVWATR